MKPSWYADNPADVTAFEQQMRRKIPYVIHPAYLWSSLVERVRAQNPELPPTLERGFIGTARGSGPPSRRANTARLLQCSVTPAHSSSPVY